MAQTLFPLIVNLRVPKQHDAFGFLLTNPCFLKSGLHLPQTHFSPDHTLQERYRELKECVEKFNLIQYGVCGFKFQSGHFVASPFNFYVYASGETIQVDRVMSFSTNALQFLRRNDFDFNALIEKGIAYMSYSEESTLIPAKKGALKGSESHTITGNNIGQLFRHRLIFEY